MRIDDTSIVAPSLCWCPRRPAIATATNRPRLETDGARCYGRAAMIELASFVSGKWQKGKGKGAELVNPSTEEVVATTTTEGIDFGAGLAFARERGGPALRAMTFTQRGEMLRAMSRAIHA